jgi:hypothetical protein
MIYSDAEKSMFDGETNLSELVEEVIKSKEPPLASECNTEMFFGRTNPDKTDSTSTGRKRT